VIPNLAKKIAPPALLLGMCLLAYGLQTPWLGFYLDDWIILAAYNAGGAERLLQYAFLDSRPLVFWTWWLGFELLGSDPLGWHLWTLLWRVLTVWAAWLALRELWPQHARRVLGAVLLFAVYPLFFQLPAALAYGFHWISFFLYCISLYWMIRAAREPQHYLLFTCLAILSTTIQLFTVEYFVGLEILRPLILYIALQSQDLPSRKRLKRAALHWGPYLLLFCGYLLWRLRFMPIPGTDRNTPQLMTNLIADPIGTLPVFASMILQDMVEGLVGVWYRTLQATTFEPAPPSNLYAWITAGIAAGLVWLVLHFFINRDHHANRSSWRSQAILLGSTAMLAGFAPGWAIGRQFTDPTGLYNDRFGLAAMLGASILLAALLDLLLRPGKIQTLAVCLLVGLAVGQHFRSTTLYRWSWEEQTRIFWQLNWRAPSLQSPTVLIGNGVLAPYMGSWANISAFNLLYFPGPASTQADTWYIDLFRTNMRQIVEERDPIRDSRKFLSIQAAAEESLVLAEELTDNQCLWILSEADRHNPYLPEEVRFVLPLSDLWRISAQGSRPREDLFGKEPARSWCYYFQKARLAEQYQDWEEMSELWDEAELRGLHPRSEPEYVPFILASAQTGRWDLALSLTKKAYFPDYVMHDYLCTTWRRIRDEVPDSPEKQQTLDQATAQFECQSIIK
jgi:hypothetical protein